MSTAPADNPRPPPTVFLSYTSEDRQAVQSLRDALPACGLEVWYDESGLSGGDAWDHKIRRQIRECDFFMPIISAQTEARPEGYFRREWRLAVERTLDMADDHTFLLPVVIDDTPEAGARVPERFLTVQWTRVPGGKPTPALEALCRRLVSGEPLAPQPPPRRAAAAPSARPQPSAARTYPPFPSEEPGQKLRFGLHVLGWGLQCGWLSFMRLPRVVRLFAYLWVFALVLAKACTPSDRHSARISAADADKVDQIAKSYQGSSNKADVTKLGAQIAQQITGEIGAKIPESSAVLAIPFSAPSSDPGTRELAHAAFTQTYGRVVVSHHGHVGLMPQALPPADPSEAAAHGRARHSKYVLYGSIDNATTPQNLVVRIVRTADATVLWSASYPLAATDPARIATDVDSRLESLEEEDE
ncbi:MAG TPA: toll/interleukin-1 receptor domain-containing protein [Steroidobacteraceae bacterium]|nr:toll/interleukin-1 receptor domain-containing protein [Steroidobacteraceae bacterium]